MEHCYDLMGVFLLFDSIHFNYMKKTYLKKYFKNNK